MNRYTPMKCICKVWLDGKEKTPIIGVFFIACIMLQNAILGGCNIIVDTFTID